MNELVYYISEKIPWAWILFGIALYFLFYPTLKSLYNISLKTKGAGIPVRLILTSLQLLLILAGFFFSVYAIKQASIDGGATVNIDHVLYLFIAFIYVLFGLALGGLGMLIYRIVKSRHDNKRSNINEEQDISVTLQDIKSATKQRKDFKEIQASLDEYFNEGGHDEKKEG